MIVAPCVTPSFEPEGWIAAVSSVYSGIVRGERQRVPVFRSEAKKHEIDEVRMPADLAIKDHERIDLSRGQRCGVRRSLDVHGHVVAELPTIGCSANGARLSRTLLVKGGDDPLLDRQSPA